MAALAVNRPGFVVATMSDTCYVYAIVPAGADLPSEVLGIDGESLELIRYGEVGAVVGPAQSPRVDRTRERLQRHKAVVEAVGRRTEALPVRFGTVLDGERQIVASLERRYEMLRRDLERLANRVEFDLLVLSNAAIPGAWESDGADEGDALAGGTIERRLRAATMPIDAALVDHSCETRWTFRGARPIACSAAYLVTPASTEPFVRAFARLSEERRDLSLVLGKPLAPYSFAGTIDPGVPEIHLLEEA